METNELILINKIIKLSNDMSDDLIGYVADYALNGSSCEKSQIYSRSLYKQWLYLLTEIPESWKLGNKEIDS